MGTQVAGKKRSRNEALGVREQPSRSAKRAKVDRSPVAKKRTTASKSATKKKRKSPVKTPKRNFDVEDEEQPPRPVRRLPVVPEGERVYWKDWKKIFLIGTEWENYETIYDIEWDFDHLSEDLASGILSKSSNTKYIFGTTESFEMAPDPNNPDDKEVYLFPVITVVDASVPPPKKIGITSVQRGEEIKDMSHLKMEWAPYHVTGNTRISKKPIAYFLNCWQRRQNLQKLSEDEVKEYEYAIPYIWFPKNDMDKEYDTEVHIISEVGGRGLNFPFDWKFDEIDEIIEEVLTKDEIPTHKEEVVTIIKEKVAEQKKKIREEKEAIKKKIESLSQKEKDSLDNLKCYKYYPQNEHYPIERTSFINRYYGKAKEVFPAVQAAIDYSNLKEIIPTEEKEEKTDDKTKK